MKKRSSISKVIIVCIAMLFILSGPTAAFADIIVQSETNGSHDFSDDWSDSETIYYSGYKCILNYGYNTFLINEDCAYAFTAGDIHFSVIQNSNGFHYGPPKAVSLWSDKEVMHAGNSVNYFQYWD